jgi:biotin carboxyl carrier protein
VPTAIRAPLTGRVWKIARAVGEAVAAGEPVVILESMKMEVPVEAPVSGTVAAVACAEGQAVEEGDILVTLG